jgi:hypothetical protein
MERCTRSNPPRQASKVGAVCGKAARTVLCGGRSAMIVPTATLSLPKRYANREQLWVFGTSCTDRTHGRVSWGLDSDASRCSRKFCAESADDRKRKFHPGPCDPRAKRMRARVRCNVVFYQIKLCCNFVTTKLSSNCCWFTGGQKPKHALWKCSSGRRGERRSKCRLAARRRSLRPVSD